ncbi:hypothetical protein Dsin_029567 [Dipteronia sinensis]|uniref:Leucine-rich repeat receptor-like serine/threonine-protein kinase n=1 Tax=Dipteronia sinensis TaxID=43782 RepID=A0AAD9ZU52_9ROSI|nr:hypothetical protein Dsin_029567 [Dipteronia sinensis]
MSSIFLLFVSILSLLSVSSAQSIRGTLINCGAVVGSIINGSTWVPDAEYIWSGTPKIVTTAVTSPILSTVRSFPNSLHQKFCYVVPVFRGGKYMVRTTYFYGGVNDRNSPPVFDQMVDGTFWGVVNTTDDYALGWSSYYEGVFLAQGKTMSVCVGSNTYTESDPFISALEFVLLGDSLYNSTDFGKHGLSLVARHSFGDNGTDNIGYPDDPFDRFWEPLGDRATAHTVAGNKNVSVSGFWNLPPQKVFETALATMELIWPPVLLTRSRYYIALYFADNPDLSPEASRVFDVIINGVAYCKNLNVTSEGVAVFANSWPLDGAMKITFNPAAGSIRGPLINGGEIFQVLDLGGRTLTRDVIALEKLRNSTQNPPPDWNGDPCLPRQYSWTGVTCSESTDGPRIRVVSLNLTNMGIAGSLPHDISRLTALTGIWLGNNSLSGLIPDFSSLGRLQTLHLEDNNFSGEIPSSLGNIQSLRELFLQNNNLTGQIPSNLTTNPGLNLKTSPGNHLSSPPPS